MTFPGVPTATHGKGRRNPWDLKCFLNQIIFSPTHGGPWDLVETAQNFVALRGMPR